MKKFEVGKEYRDRTGMIVKCIRRTDKSVYFSNKYHSDYRQSIKMDSEGNEFTTTTIKVKDVEA